MQSSIAKIVTDEKRHEFAGPKDLMHLLNLLDLAKHERNDSEITRIENLIKGIIPHGIYEGYLDDNTEFSIVELTSVERKRSGANIHSFIVKLLVQFDPASPQREPYERELDLIEFLGTVQREQYGRAQCGPRFWQP